MHRSIFHLLGVALVATLALAGALVAPLASAAPTAQQAGTCDGSGGVYLYEGYNYTGRCLRFTQDVADLSAYNFNNATSSIRIIGDYTAVLYVDQNFSNVASAYGFDSTDLRGSVVDDNRASSLRVISGYRQTGDEICRGDGIYLYEETDYRGRCVRYTGDDSDFSDERFNNQASSVRVVGNYSATIYVDQNYGGASVTVSGNIPDLGPTALGNDRASSIRVSSGASGANACNGQDGVYLFEHPNFQGRCVRFTGNVPDLRVFGFDDTASSIRLIGGWTATLFRDLNGTGVSTTFSGDDANLADNPIGDNQATSLVASRGGTPPPPPSGNACDGQEGVYLYEHPNFQGRCLRLTSGAGDLRVFGFDDITSSIRIVGNWTATLFRDLTGSGVSQVFTQDNANLAGQPIGDNQATSVAVVRGGAAPPPPPPSGGVVAACDGQEGVYLYEGTNYSGACIRVTGDIADLRPYNLNDAISSVRVFGRWTVVLFRDLNYSGISSTFTESDPDLRNDGIGSNEATSVVVRRR